MSHNSPQLVQRTVVGVSLRISIHASTMLEILVVIAVGAAIMVALAKRGRGRRRMGKYLRGNIDENLSVGTLTAGTLISAVFDETVNERTLVSSIVASWTLSNMTPGEGIGPLVVGVAHSDYTDAEIEAYIENTGSWNEGSLVESREVGKRLVRRVGQFPIPPDASGGVVLNDGKPIKTKLNWIMTQGQTLRYWAYNQGTAAFATTDPDVRLQGHANLWPR